MTASHSPTAPGPTPVAPFALLRQSLPERRLALLFVLAICASLSEGAGLLLLVPILQILADPAATNPILDVWRSIGLPDRLDILLAAFVAIVGVRALLTQWRQIVELEVQVRTGDNLRRRVFAALGEAGWRYLSGLGRGEALNAAVGAVDRVKVGLQGLLTLTTATITLAAMLGAALLIAPLPALGFGLGGVAVLALFARLRRRAHGVGARLNAGFGAQYEFYARRIEGLRIVKSFGREAQEVARGDAIAGRLRHDLLAYQRDIARGQFALQAGAAFVLALGVWVAVVIVGSPVAALLPLVALTARCVPLLGALQFGWQNWAHARAPLDHIRAVLADADAAREPDGGDMPGPALSHTLALEAVSVVHPGRARPVLDSVSLTLSAGEIVALTGPSGSGKSTIADVMAGMILPDAGLFTIDGESVDWSVLRGWRRRVAYAQQEPLLFGGSIRDNLHWADPCADEDAMRDALRRASAAFVFALPQGLDSPVGDAGRALSGGERQRIVLARALLRDPALLILDEATSALDSANEAAIARAVERLRGSMTIIIIGHRGALVALADRVFTLQDGRIVDHEARREAAQ